MDPLNALSLAGTLLQFVEFSTKIFLGAKGIYKSSNGTLSVNEELELIASDSNSVLSKLKAHAQSPDHSVCLSNTANHDAQDDFKKVCDEATSVADELTKRFQSFKVQGKVSGYRRTWQSLSQAIKSAWSHEEIVSLQLRLKDLKKALETRVLLSFRDNFDLFSTQVSRKLDALDIQTRNIISALVENQKTTMNRITTESLEQTATIAHLLSRINIDNPRGRHKTSTAGIDDEEIFNGAEVVSFGQHGESQLRREVNNKILELLRFESMTHRLEKVTEAHESTFLWRFGTEMDPKARSSLFSDWIGHENSLYWLKGKAGSGKSTLMKCIFEDPRLREHLSIWASDTPVYLASFFFWSSATTSIQKSEQGLLRALLFQILNQQTDLIPIVFPLLWARAYSHLLLGNSRIVDEYWSSRTLKIALQILTTQKIVPAKICLLIDGFDELEGDTEELATLADFLKGLASPTIKMCISSRPWLVFEECFKYCEGLRLQDHTRPDIKSYVRNTLLNNHGFQNLSMRDSFSAEAFVQAISERADGVFLWVVLAVKSLLSGIRNRDAIMDLQDRLNRLPRELEPLYGHLINLIDPEYFEWSSKAFQIMRSNQQYHERIREYTFNPMTDYHSTSMDSFDAFGKRYNKAKSLSILDLHLALDAGNDASVQDWSAQMILERCEDTEVHLTARCAGLLEVWHLGSSDPKSEIHYLHRTVQEYIIRPHVWELLKKRTSCDTFSPHVSLSKCCILKIGIDQQKRREQSWYLRLAFHALIHASEADGGNYKVPPVLLDRLETLMSMHTSIVTTGTVKKHWSQPWTDYLGLAPASSFLPVAVMFNLISYLYASRHLIRSHTLTANPSIPLLHYSIPRLCSPNTYMCSVPKPHVVEILLEAKENPNISCPNASPYQETLIFAENCQIYEDKLLAFTVLAKMLDFGANPQVGGGIGQNLYALTVLDNFSHSIFSVGGGSSCDLPMEAVTLRDAIEHAIERTRTPLETTLFQGQKKPSPKRLSMKRWIKKIKISSSS